MLLFKGHWVLEGHALLSQVYNLGYDASKIAVPRNGYAIHHPAGNFARLSMFNSTACAPGHVTLLMTLVQFCIVSRHTSACLSCCMTEVNPLQPA